VETLGWIRAALVDGLAMRAFSGVGRAGGFFWFLMEAVIAGAVIWVLVSNLKNSTGGKKS
jgi:hypothetical protein